MPNRLLPPLPRADQLLSGPGARSARLLCRHYALAAGAAISAIDEQGDAGVTARHDFRVALRRLRATLDGYEAVLRDTVQGKLSRRAQTLARRLSAARDCDVLGALITTTMKSRSKSHRTAIAALHLAARDAVAVDVAALRRRWERLARDLRDGVAEWHEQHRLDGPHGALPFSRIAADALDHATDRVARRCAAMGAPTDLAAMHAARLALKTVRYLLAPLASGTTDGDALLSALRDAQDHLGTIREAYALRVRIAEALTIGPDAPRLAKATLSALNGTTRDLDARISASFDALAPWCDAERRHGYIARLRAIADSWRTGGAPPVEIERKWLLSALPPRLHGLTPALLHQGYLPGDILVERIRSVTRAGVTDWFRTVKLGRGISRIEVEESTTPELGATLFELTPGKRVGKRRYTVDDGALTWEIDDFTDRALVLAEVELPREDTPVELPVWLAPYVVREVTGETEFTNWQLAR